MTGKGSNPRPMSVSRDAYRDNWDATFKRRVARLASPRVMRFNCKGRVREIDFTRAKALR